MSSDSGLLAPMWAGRPGADLVDDEAWLRAMLEFEVALARTQAELGVVPQWALPAIERAAAAGLDVTAISHRARGAANPVVALVEDLTAAVARLSGRSAEFVHRGSTSQDVLDTAAMLVAARVLDRIDDDLGRSAEACAGLADRHRDTVQAGRTLTQHAVPITFGLKAAGWLCLVLDARDRVRAVRASLPVQLGGAAGTLAAYAEYARLAGGDGPAPDGTELIAPLAARLGLAEPTVPWHALRTPIADLGAVLSFVTGALGKVGADVQVMARTEMGEVAEPAATGRGVSSAMPQKRNPVLATLLVAGARQGPAQAMVLAQSLMTEDERSAGGWHAEWQPLRELLRLAAGSAETAAELTSGLIVFPDRMRANVALTGAAIVTERLAALLTPELGKVAAKKLLARVTREGGDVGELLGERLAGALRPEEYLGAANGLIDRALRRCDGGAPL